MYDITVLLKVHLSACDRCSTECPSNYFVFPETVKMSTYLVAIVVSNLQSLKIDNKYAVFARDDAVLNQANYSLLLIEPLVKFFETTFNQKYPLSKLDMVALPDFEMSAMENWGLLTYRESSLLYDYYESPVTSKQAIRNVIAHEIAHQWFGNLVSPLWWSYLWLNEGFGRYFQYHATATVRNRECTIEVVPLIRHDDCTKLDERRFICEFSSQPIHALRFLDYRSFCRIVAN